MGWDISYHPISEKQISEWYFDVLENQIEDFYKEKYKETIKIGLETKNEDVSIQLIDFRGRVVRQYDNVKTDRLIIKKDELSIGMYYLNLKINKRPHRKTIIIQ